MRTYIYRVTHPFWGPPIFVMMTNDVEMSRIEGFGEDFFFPRLARLLEESQAKGHPDPAETSAPLRSMP
jgi:hypothetical protein